MLASFLAGCSSFFYKEQVSITGIYWISNSKAIELDLLFLERSSFNPLDGTTVKKGFRTDIKVIDIDFCKKNNPKKKMSKKQLDK